MSYRRQRQAILQSAVAIIAVVALLITATSIGILYEAALALQRERLGETTRTLARLFESIARYDLLHSQAWPARARSATLSQIVEAHRTYEGFGQTGEFLLAQQQGERIDFLLVPRHPTNTHSRTIALGSRLAQPMQRALRGESGTLIGLDYRGEWVLAAFQPVPALGVGVVAKIDLAEIRAPFIRAAFLSVVIALALILIGGQLVRRFIFPLLGQLEASERRYHTLFELSPYGVMVIDPNSGVLVDFNRAGHTSLGYTRPEFQHLRPCDIDIAHDERLFRRRMETIRREGSATYHSRQRTKGGEIREVHVTAALLRINGQSVVYAIHQDVTEQMTIQQELHRHRHHLEQMVEEQTRELRETNERLVREIRERQRAETELQVAGIVYRNTSEGIFLTDMNGTILTVNPAFSAITGYTAQEAIGKTPRILKSGQQDAAFYERMWSALLDEGQWQGEIWNRRKNGEAYLQWLTVTLFRGDSGLPKNYVAVFNDITELHHKEERIRHQAYHDALTGLPNRTLFQDRLIQAVAHARRHRQLGAVMFLDLDRFKVINDTLGHEVGDELLRETARRLTGCLRQDDTISRLGGDEFAVLAVDLTSPEAAEGIAFAIKESMATPFHIQGHEMVLSVSIGISVFPSDGQEVAALLRNADAAMYRAKERGRNTHQFYTADLNARALERLALESDLRLALERQQLEVYYQPRVGLQGGTIVGMEALVRWRRSNEELLSAEAFIPVAEETGLVCAIGEWVLETACRDTRHWVEAGYSLRVSVNISPHQFSRSDLVRHVQETLAAADLPARCLELELTETLVMQHPETTSHILRQLKQQGVSIAIDDFGTGYSSLSYLTHFPIDVLKIDRSFIRKIGQDPDSLSITGAIIDLGHNLRLETVAEGVETQAQYDFLRGRDCDQAQGYLLGPPLPPREFEELLAQGRRGRSSPPTSAERPLRNA